ncbi:hypothetical protein [uncultured Prevotella sp.]|uniref:hypothetical protein n=1 Tax=uncultured Prevotella sp. TaxID=159272 RepID=UPI00266B9324|nr:hypothetical protein [uncultured Prevotella sp.]
MSNKKHLLITGLLLCAGHMAYAQSTYKSFAEATINSVSPNGSYVVGNNLGYATSPISAASSIPPPTAKPTGAPNMMKTTTTTRANSKP